MKQAAIADDAGHQGGDPRRVETAVQAGQRGIDAAVPGAVAAAGVEEAGVDQHDGDHRVDDGQGHAEADGDRQGRGRRAAGRNR